MTKPRPALAAALVLAALGAWLMAGTTSSPTATRTASSGKGSERTLGGTGPGAENAARPWRSMPAVDFTLMADPGYKNENVRVPDFRDDPVGPHAVLPEPAELASQCFADAARIIELGDSFIEENENSTGFLPVYPVQVSLGLAVEFNLPGHTAS